MPIEKYRGGQAHIIPWRKDENIDVFGVLDSTKVHLTFTSEEEERGIASLRDMGVGEKDEFICFHTRDSAYLETVLPDRDWSYHDYRNADIQDFILAAETMADRGYKLIRMGADVKVDVRTDHKGIIDYAANGRTDFLDIYLASHCKFFLGGATGMSNIPMMFRHPVVGVNVIPYISIGVYTHRDLIIPKKIWIKAEKRFLTYKEIFSSDIGSYTHSQQYAEKGLEVISNTPEEIMEAAKEMDEIIKGQRTYDEEDRYLQKRFYSFYEEKNISQKLLPRVGSAFLKQNRDLLLCKPQIF